MLKVLPVHEELYAHISIIGLSGKVKIIDVEVTHRKNSYQKVLVTRTASLTVLLSVPLGLTLFRDMFCASDQFNSYAGRSSFANGKDVRQECRGHTNTRRSFDVYI